MTAEEYIDQVRPPSRMGRPSTAVSVKCAGCGTEFRLTPSAIKRGFRCCSMECRDMVRKARIYNAEAQTKRCTRCQEWKPFADFSQARGTKKSPARLQSYCRFCCSVANADYRRADLSRHRERQRRYVASNRARLNAMNRERSRDPVRRAALNAKQREYSRRFPEWKRLHNKVRVHRQRAAGPLSIRGVRDLLLKQRHRCAVCSGELPPKGYHLDHILAIAKGGTNDPVNLQILCAPCNLAKGTRDSISFMQERGLLL